MALAGLAGQAHAASSNDAGKINLSISRDAVLDGPTLARELVTTFMTDEKWQVEVEKLRSKYQDWERDSRGDIGQYLNDRLICVALGAAGGDVEKIQRGIVWLAFYKEFNQEAHPQVLKFLREHRGTMLSLLNSFTWDKASQYVKNKEWRKDLEKAKEKEKEEARPQPEVSATTGSRSEVDVTPVPPKVVPVPAPKPQIKPTPMSLSVPEYPWLSKGAEVYSAPVDADAALSGR
ncbi:MAG: hypothetical protein KIS92_25245 [Planctomycetota bacterium]|nr:hypothetical protein [Planctomycetota bacterium]